MGPNRWVRYAAVCLVVIVMLILFRGGQEATDASDTPRVLGGGALSDAALAGLGIEADTEKDTVATLIAQTKDMKDELGQLRGENSALREDNAQLKGMEQALARRLENKVDAASAEALRKAEIDVNQLVQRLDNATQRLAMAENTRSIDRHSTHDTGEMTWIQPLGRAPIVAGVTHTSGFMASLDNQSSGLSDRLGVAELTGMRTRASDDDPVVPYFTIARNATLVSSTAMTALVGRVPFGGQVTDPYSFKVIIGQDNLMANGMELPDVAYAIASGKAVGDWTLGCVRGDLFSLTFVFADGTIRTVPKADDIDQGNANQREIKIGELSDRFGNPCVTGQRISNATDFLKQRIAVVGVQAAAEAAAASQTTQVTSVGGGGVGVASIVDGSTGEFIIGRSIADGADEIARWLDERQSQQFDAIYVSPGADVSLHITEQITIDYDPKGRKTHHTAMRIGGYRELY